MTSVTEPALLRCVEGAGVAGRWLRGETVRARFVPALDAWPRLVVASPGSLPAVRRGASPVSFVLEHPRAG